MAAGNQALWKSVCEVVGRDDLLADARFADTSLRARNQDALREILKPSSPATRPRPGFRRHQPARPQPRAARDPETIFAGDEAASWLARFREAGVPCAPINTYSEVLADPQVEHMGWVQPLATRRAHAHLRPGALRRTDHGAASPPASAGRAQRGSAGRAARKAGMSDITETDGLRVERRGALHLLTLARPDKMNALSAGLVEALIAAVDRAQASAPAWICSAPASGWPRPRPASACRD